MYILSFTYWHASLIDNMQVKQILLFCYTIPFKCVSLNAQNTLTSLTAWHLRNNKKNNIQGSRSGSKQFSHPFYTHNRSVSNGKFVTSKDISSCPLQHNFFDPQQCAVASWSWMSTDWNMLWRFSDAGSLESLMSLEELHEKQKSFITKQSGTAWLY